VGARDEHRAPCGIDRPRRGAEVLRVFDTVEHHDDRVDRPLPSRQVPLAERARRPEDARGHAAMIVGELVEVLAIDLSDAYAFRPSGVDHVAHPWAAACATRDQHLVGDAGPHRLEHRTLARDDVGGHGYAITAIARQPTPSPASPSPSGRVALTDT
jgi:hypothetical protein